MKKLVLALAAALLAFTSCGEKTFKWENLKFTYPSNWDVSSNDNDYGTLLYFQDNDNLSNSINIDITAMNMEKVNEMSPEEFTDFFKEQVENFYESWIEEDDDYEISFKADTKATDTQALMTVSGKAYGEKFTGSIQAYISDEYLFVAFISAVDDSHYDTVAQILNYELI